MFGLLRLLRFFGQPVICFVVVHYAPECGEEHLIGKPVCRGIESLVAEAVRKSDGKIDKVISDNLDGFSFLDLALHPNHFGARVFDNLGIEARKLRSLFEDYLSGHRICDILGERASGEAVAKTELLVVFIAAHLGQIVSSRIEEQHLYQVVGALESRRLAGSELSVNLFKTLVVIFGRILCNGLFEALIRSE